MPSPESSRAIFQETIDTLYRQASTVLGALFMVSTVLLFVFVGGVPRQMLFGWYAAVLGLTVVRYGSVLVYRRRRARGLVGNPLVWGRLFVLGSLSSGILWGAVGYLFADAGNIETTVVIVTVLTGLVAGSIASLSVYLPAMYAFVLPASLSLAPLFASYPQQGQSLLVLQAIYIVSISFLGRRLNRVFITSIARQFENRGLLEELRLQKNAAEQANAQKSRFLAAASHDLRQPLHATMMFQQAMRETGSASEREQLLDKAILSTRSMAEMLNALLGLSQLDAGTVVPQRRCFESASAVSRVVDEMRAAAVTAGVELRVRVGVDLRIWSDPLLVERILRNLLHNAIQHCPGAKVLVSAQRRGGGVRLGVWDSGPGIAAVDLTRVFDEHVQLGNPERDINRGLGLGLNIVKRLARVLDTEVEVRSTLGKGSRFWLTLPSCDGGLGDFGDIVGSAEPREVSGLFVLVVEDDVRNREALRALLRGWDCEVLAVEDEGEALYLFAGEPYPAPDVILADYRLREHVVGTEVVTRLREHFGAPIPAIIVTGDIGAGVSEDVVRVGAQLMMKPIVPERLKAALGEIAHAADGAA